MNITKKNLTVKFSAPKQISWELGNFLLAEAAKVTFFEDLSQQFDFEHGLSWASLVQIAQEANIKEEYLIFCYCKYVENLSILDKRLKENRQLIILAIGIILGLIFFLLINEFSFNYLNIVLFQISASRLDVNLVLAASFLFLNLLLGIQMGEIFVSVWLKVIK